MPYYAALISLLTNPPTVPLPAEGEPPVDPATQQGKETVGRTIMEDLVRGFKVNVDERKWREIRLTVSCTV